MALIPGLSSLFSSAPSPARAEPTLSNTAPAQTNTTVPSQATMKSDGSVLAIPAAGVGEQSPIGEYDKLWDTKVTPVDASTMVPAFTADPSSMLKSAQTFDFTRGIDATMLANASKGDAGALATVLNQAAQFGFAQSTATTVNIVKSALERQAQQFETKYAPAMLRNNAIDGAVKTNVELANNPATAPIVDMVTKQLAATYPNATPAEIAEHANKYMSDFAAAATKASGGKITTKAELEAQTAGQLTRPDEDWERFFDVNASMLPN